MVCCSMRAPVHERGQRRCLFPSLHDLLDGLNNGSETSSSAMKDLQSKLDTVSAECLTEKEKNKKLIMENEKLQYRITHLIRAIKEAESR